MPHAEKSILITGASGFTGVHASRKAAEMGMKVTCISRTPFKQPHCKVTACDLTDYEQIDGIIMETKPDYVLHLAGFNNARLSWETPLECLESNIFGTLNLLEAVRRHIPASKSLIIGSALQFSPSHNESAPHPYSLGKTFQVLLSQEWKKLFSMNIAVAKPSNLIGPGHSDGICSKIAQKIVIAEQQDEPLFVQLQNRKAQCDFVDVRDAVEAYLLILMNDSRFDHFEIGSGQSTALEELIRRYEVLTPQPIQLTVEHSQESTEIKLDLEPIYSLGWKPRYSLEASLADILSFYKSIPR